MMTAGGGGKAGGGRGGGGKGGGGGGAKGEPSVLNGFPPSSLSVSPFPPPRVSSSSSLSPDHHLWISSLVWPDIPADISISCISVNPQGTLLATGTHTGHIYVWQLAPVHASISTPRCRSSWSSPPQAPSPSEACREGALCQAASLSNGVTEKKKKKKKKKRQGESRGRRERGGGEGEEEGDIRVFIHCRGEGGGLDDNVVIPSEGSVEGGEGAHSDHSPTAVSLQDTKEKTSDPDLPPSSEAQGSHPRHEGSGVSLPVPLSSPSSSSSCCSCSASPPAAPCLSSASCERPLPFLPHLILLSEWGGAAALVECVFGLSSSPLLQASSEEVLVSIHSDNKLRIWSLLEGRCLSVTKHFPFPLLSMRILADRRYALLRGSTGVLIFDLWSRCRVCYLSLSSLPLLTQHLPRLQYDISPSTSFHRTFSEPFLSPVDPSASSSSSSSPRNSSRGPGEGSLESRQRGFERKDGFFSKPLSDQKLPQHWPFLSLVACCTNGPPACSADAVKRLRSLFPGFLLPSRLPSSPAITLSPTKSSGKGEGKERNQEDEELDALLQEYYSQQTTPAAPAQPSSSSLPPVLEQPIVVAGVTTEGRVAIWDLRPVLFLWEEQQKQSDRVGGTSLFHGKREYVVFSNLVVDEPRRKYRNQSTTHHRATTADSRTKNADTARREGGEGEREGRGITRGVTSLNRLASGTRLRKHSLNARTDRSLGGGGVSTPKTKGQGGGKGRGGGGEEDDGSVGSGAAVLQPMRTMFEGMFRAGAGGASTEEGEDEEDAGDDLIGGWKRSFSRGVEPLFLSSVCCQENSVIEVGGSGVSSQLAVTASYVSVLTPHRLLVYRRRSSSDLSSFSSVSLAPLYEMYLSVPAAFSSSGDPGAWRTVNLGEDRPFPEEKEDLLLPLTSTSASCPREHPSSLDPSAGPCGDSTFIPWIGVHTLSYTESLSALLEGYCCSGPSKPRGACASGELASPPLPPPPCSSAGWKLATRPEGKGKGGFAGEDAEGFFTRTEEDDDDDLARSKSKLDTSESFLLAWRADGSVYALPLPLFPSTQDSSSSAHSRIGGELDEDSISLSRSSGSPQPLLQFQDAGEERGGRSRGGLMHVGWIPDVLLGGEDTPTPIFLPLISGVASSSGARRRPPQCVEKDSSESLLSFLPATRKASSPCEGGLLMIGVSLKCPERITLGSWKISTFSCSAPLQAPLLHTQLARSSSSILIHHAIAAKEQKYPSPGFAFSSSSSSLHDAASASHGSTVAEDGVHTQRRGISRCLQFSLYPSFSLKDIWRLPSILKPSLERTLHPPNIPTSLERPLPRSSASSLPESSLVLPPACTTRSGAQAKDPHPPWYAHASKPGTERLGDSTYTYDTATRTSSSCSGSLMYRRYVSYVRHFLACLQTREDSLTPPLFTENCPLSLALHSRTLPPSSSQGRSGKDEEVHCSSVLRDRSSLSKLNDRDRDRRRPHYGEGRRDASTSTTTERRTPRHVLSWCLVESNGRVFLISSSSDGSARALCLNHVASRLRRSPHYCRPQRGLHRQHPHKARPPHAAGTPIASTATGTTSLGTGSADGTRNLSTTSPPATANDEEHMQNAMQKQVGEVQRTLLKEQRGDGDLSGGLLGGVVCRQKNSSPSSSAGDSGRPASQSDGEEELPSDSEVLFFDPDYREEGEDDVLYLNGRPFVSLWPKASHLLPSLIELPTPAEHPDFLTTCFDDLACSASRDADSRVWRKRRQRKRTERQKAADAVEGEKRTEGAEGGGGCGQRGAGDKRNDEEREHEAERGTRNSEEFRFLKQPSEEDSTLITPSYRSSSTLSSFSSRRSLSVDGTSTTKPTATLFSDNEEKTSSLSTSTFHSSSSYSTSSSSPFSDQSASSVSSSESEDEVDEEEEEGRGNGSLPRATSDASQSSSALSSSSPGSCSSSSPPPLAIAKPRDSSSTPVSPPRPAVSSALGSSPHGATRGKSTRKNHRSCPVKHAALYASPTDRFPTLITHFCSLSSILLAGGTNRGDLLFWRVPSFTVCGFLPRVMYGPVSSMIRVLSVYGGDGETQFDSNCFLVADVSNQLTLVDAAKCCGCTDTSSGNSASLFGNTNPTTAEQQQIHAQKGISSHSCHTDVSNMSTKGLVESPMYIHYRSSTWSVRTPQLLSAVPRPCNWSGVFPLERILHADQRGVNVFYPHAGGDMGEDYSSSFFSTSASASSTSSSSSPLAPGSIRKVAIDMLSDTLCCITSSSQYYLWKIQTGRFLKEGHLSQIPGVFTPDIQNAESVCSRMFLQNPRLYSSSPHLEMTAWGFALGNLQLPSSSCCACCSSSSSPSPSDPASPCAFDQTSTCERATTSRASEGNTSPNRKRANRGSPDRTPERISSDCQGSRRGWGCGTSTPRGQEICRDSFECHQTLPSAAVLLLPLTQFLQSCLPPLVPSSSSPGGGGGGGSDSLKKSLASVLPPHALGLCSLFFPFGLSCVADGAVQQLFPFMSPSPLPLVQGVVGADLSISFPLPFLLIYGHLYDWYLQHIRTHQAGVSAESVFSSSSSSVSDSKDRVRESDGSSLEAAGAGDWGEEDEESWRKALDAFQIRMRAVCHQFETTDSGGGTANPCCHRSCLPSSHARRSSLDRPSSLTSSSPCSLLLSDTGSASDQRLRALLEVLVAKDVALLAHTTLNCSRNPAFLDDISPLVLRRQSLQFQYQQRMLSLPSRPATSSASTSSTTNHDGLATSTPTIPRPRPPQTGGGLAAAGGVASVSSSSSVYVWLTTALQKKLPRLSQSPLVLQALFSAGPPILTTHFNSYLKKSSSSPSIGSGGSTSFGRDTPFSGGNSRGIADRGELRGRRGRVETVTGVQSLDLCGLPPRLSQCSLKELRICTASPFFYSSSFSSFPPLSVSYGGLTDLMGGAGGGGVGGGGGGGASSRRGNEGYHSDSHSSKGSGSSSSSGSTVSSVTRGDEGRGGGRVEGGGGGGSRRPQEGGVDTTGGGTGGGFVFGSFLGTSPSAFLSLLSVSLAGSSSSFSSSSSSSSRSASVAVCSGVEESRAAAERRLWSSVDENVSESAVAVNPRYQLIQLQTQQKALQQQLMALQQYQAHLEQELAKSNLDAEAARPDSLERGSKQTQVARTGEEQEDKDGEKKLPTDVCRASSQPAHPQHSKQQGGGGVHTLEVKQKQLARIRHQLQGLSQHLEQILHLQAYLSSLVERRGGGGGGGGPAVGGGGVGLYLIRGCTRLVSLDLFTCCSADVFPFSVLEKPGSRVQGGCLDSHAVPRSPGHPHGEDHSRLPSPAVMSLRRTTPAALSSTRRVWIRPHSFFSKPPADGWATARGGGGGGGGVQGFRGSLPGLPSPSLHSHVAHHHHPPPHYLGKTSVFGGWPGQRFSMYKDTVLSSASCADLLRVSCGVLSSPQVASLSALSFNCLLAAALLPSLAPPPPSASSRAALIETFYDVFSLELFCPLTRASGSSSRFSSSVSPSRHGKELEEDGTKASRMQEEDSRTRRVNLSGLIDLLDAYDDAKTPVFQGKHRCSATAGYRRSVERQSLDDDGYDEETSREGKEGNAETAPGSHPFLDRAQHEWNLIGPFSSQSSFCPPLCRWNTAVAPSLWILTQCLLKNYPPSTPPPTGGHAANHLHHCHSAATPRTAVYVHFGSCQVLRHTICRMDSKQLLPYIDVCLHILASSDPGEVWPGVDGGGGGGFLSLLPSSSSPSLVYATPRWPLKGRGGRREGLAEEVGEEVALFPPHLLDELEQGTRVDAALVLMSLIVYERPDLCSVAGLHIASIVSHHLAYAFLACILPEASSSPSSSFLGGGGLIAPSPLPPPVGCSEPPHCHSGRHHQPTGGGGADGRARCSSPAQPLSSVPELLMEVFAIGLGVVWEPSHLSTRRISVLLNLHLSKNFSLRLREGGGSGAATPEQILPDEIFLSQLIATMFGLSLHPRWSACSSLILTRLARANFSLFIKVMGKAAKTIEFGSEFTTAALITLVQFVIRTPELSLEFLPDVVETIVRCLDPAEPHLRRRALHAATASLFQLVRKFPMVTFHQQTQRFSVGCTDGLIVLYDLRTATKWKVLEGHTSGVTCLAFSDDGALLGSYSMGDCTMRLWQSSSSGFFGGILGISAKSQKVIQLPPCPRNVLWQSVVYQLDTVRMMNKSKTEWMLRREDGKGYMVLVS